MRKSFLLIPALVLLFSCSGSDNSGIPEASAEQISHVEPPCWWSGMVTSLQLMVHGDEISFFDVSVDGKGLKIKEIHKADSPNYLFLDIDVRKAGEYDLIFRRGDVCFRYPYTVHERRPAERESFTTADMIYLIMPDRFANGDPSNDTVEGLLEPADRKANLGRHGGDIQGIIDHLDYISGLGATAIWCTPLLENDMRRASYHGYSVTNHYLTDPRFGTNELFAEFCSKAHGKGLKVIMDIVTNHCGTGHWFMKDLPFADWIHQFPEYTGTNVCFSTNMDPNASQYDLNLQESGWFVRSMPDMNLDNPFTLKYLQQWAIWWIEYAGLDGLRVDTYPYNEKEPMSEWCSAVLAEYPWINIVGECWTSEYDQLAYWQGGNANRDGFDSHLPSIMDFPLQESILAALNEAGDNPAWGRGMTRVYDALSHDGGYHDLSKMMTFLANHDHDRLGDTFGRDTSKMKIALALLATVRGIPQLYYGDEMFFCRVSGPDRGDGAKRIDFPGGWPGDEVDLFENPTGMHDYTARLFNWRKNKPVLHHGKTLHFLSRDNTYAFFRYDSSDCVFVFVNNSDSVKDIQWNHYLELVPERVEARDVLTGSSIVLQGGLAIPARSVLIAEFKR